MDLNIEYSQSTHFFSKIEEILNIKPIIFTLYQFCSDFISKIDIEKD